VLSWTLLVLAEEVDTKADEPEYDCDMDPVVVHGPTDS
jgi:hypothetical protein